MVRLDPPSAGSTRQLDLISKDLSSSIRDSFGAESQASSEYFAHSTITPYRTEDLPGFVKQSRSQKVERTFNKNNSVFKEWKQDTAQRLDDCLEHDVALWKVHKFVKDKEELQKCTALIKKDFATFKMIYTYYATLAAYPYINAECMLRFVKDFKLMDKNLTQELVVTAYTGSWTTPKKTAGTQPDHLLRFQFLEWLIRLAKAKYLESKRVGLPSEALRMFLDKDILPNSVDIVEEWDGFRTNSLWTMEVNDIFKPNLNNIKLLMKRFYEPRKDKLTTADAVSIFSSLTSLLPEVTSMHIYGMSKMTCIQETKEIGKYKTLNNVTELIEMIGRAAQEVYKEEADLTLVEKII